MFYNLVRLNRCGSGVKPWNLHHEKGISDRPTDKSKDLSQIKRAASKDAKDASKPLSSDTPPTPRNQPPENILTNTKTSFGGLNDCDRIFQNLYGRHDWRLKDACNRGDWYRTAELLDMGPEWIMNEVKKSGLRGRGGAGFYAGIKWDFLRNTQTDAGKVLIVNCAEGEPGTCKDREIIRHEPHKVIEGCLLAGFAMGCERAIIYVRNRFYNEACNLQFAIAEAYRHGMLGLNACDTDIKFDLQIQRGDRYVCGEETALVNSLMGKLGRPRRRPPYLTQNGYFSHPCLVVNCESISVLPTILRRGSKWFSGLGRSYNSGTKLFSISGEVNCPCTVEEEMSVPLRYLIETHAGGVTGGWDNLLAIFPGGLSTTLISKTAAEGVAMDFDCLENAGSALGSGAVIVLSKNSDPLHIMHRSIQFFEKQTCKQCTLCRDGGIWLPEMFGRFVKGNAHPHEMEFLQLILNKMEKSNPICALCESQVNVGRGLLGQFSENIEQRIFEYGKDQTPKSESS